jgi:hypothetical protein
MIEISLRDGCFSHTDVGLGNILPSKIKFNRDNNTWLDICLFTDGPIKENLVLTSKSKINIAWICEPLSINYETFKAAYENMDKYDYILTHNLEFINLDPKKISYYPFGGCWINPNDRQIHPKNKNISIIASEKDWTIGHRMRHSVIKNFTSHLDLICGRGYNPIDSKITALKDFRYSFIIENDNNNIYFSEKLIDSLTTGTIPIFWGSDISKIFDMNGIIKFSSLEELNGIIKNCNEDFYNSKIESIKNNFEIAKQFICPEDWIYDNFLSRILK